MKYLPTNTLAHFNNAPQVHQHDLSGLPTTVFSAATVKYRATCGTTSPHADAVSFYTLNHGAAIVRKQFTENEPLPEWAQKILTTYTDATMAQGERLLHYLLCITTRETRHMKSGTPEFWTKVKSLFGDASVNLLKDISTNGDDSHAVKKYMVTPPNMPIGQFAKTLSYGFHKGSYGGGYGGEKWGYTTDALVAYLTGETSMEMLVDTGYTLAHNGGPIFDKGMMYSHYDSSLLTILDLQRAGQLVELILGSENHGIHKTPEAIETAALIKQYQPREINGYIDWKLVDSLRPDKSAHPNKYAKQIAAQKQPKATAKPVAPVFTMVQGKKAKVTGTWTVFPHQTVTVLERVGG